MIALALRVTRTFPSRTWLLFAVLAAFLIFGGYCAHRGAEGVRDRQAAKVAKVEAKASSARETGAEEALTDTTTIRNRQVKETMPRKPFLMACLMIVSCGVAVASCETTGASLPRAEDLRVLPKPVPSDEVLTSRIAGEKHDNAVEAWGEAG